jgi:O-antigen/teichoic acid export membrane protein
MAGLWGTLQIGLGITGALSAFTGISLYLLADPIAIQLFHEAALAPLLRVMSLVVPLLALSDIVVTATHGFKRMEYFVIGQKVSQPATRLILTVALVIIVGLDARKALIAYGLSIIVAFVVLLYFLNRLFPLKRPLRTARRDTGTLLRFALPVYLSDLIQTFGGNIQTIVLGMLNTAANVGIFGVASQINLVGQLFHGSVVAATAPIVSELHDQREWERMGRFYQTVTKWTFTLNLPLFLVVVLFPRPILSIFGQSFVGGATALTILAWANLVNAGTGICEVVVHMTGNTTLKLANSLITFVIALGLNILLIPVWGLIGAAVAALSAASILNLLRLVEVYFLFRLLPYNLSFAKPIAAGLTALSVAESAHLLFLPDTNLLYTAMNATILLVVYAGVLILLGFSQEDRMVLARARRRLSVALSK